MKIALLLLLPLAASAWSLKRSGEAPEQAFWKWFQNNETMLFDFEKDQEKNFDRLAAEMHKVDPALTFEFGPKEGGRREFVISADGIRSAFPKVEALYAAAPSLGRWKFIKFRPRRRPFDVTFGNVSVNARSVLVGLKAAGPKADITVFMPGYSPSARKAYTSVAFILLDHALGEYDVETRVGDIEVRVISEAPATALSLEALPATFDSLFPTH
jgi:hypothetical protein